MSEHILAERTHHIGIITLNRPQALNSLSLDMVREITTHLLAWREDHAVRSVLIRSSSEKAFCAGGDIRFLYEAGTGTPQVGSARLEDFFTEEYALNHLIHSYPKPYIAIMDGIVMGGGMGLTQGATPQHLRIVTERTRMAMPEVKIGFVPDIGASYFLSRTPGQIGTYLAVTGEEIGAADALYAGLADVFIPSAQLPALLAMLRTSVVPDAAEAVHRFAREWATSIDLAPSMFASERQRIDQHFRHSDMNVIVQSLASDHSPFAKTALVAIAKRSPLMMCVALEEIRRGALMTMADCLRMERSIVRHCFEYGEVLEGIRSVVIDKDHAPQWSPSKLSEATSEMAASFFRPAWPAHAHPLRHL